MLTIPTQDPAAACMKAHQQAARDFLSMGVGKPWKGTCFLANEAGYLTNTAPHNIYMWTFSCLIDHYGIELYMDAFGNLTKWNLTAEEREQIKEDYSL